MGEDLGWSSGATFFKRKYMTPERWKKMSKKARAASLRATRRNIRNGIRAVQAIARSVPC